MICNQHGRIRLKSLIFDWSISKSRLVVYTGIRKLHRDDWDLNLHSKANPRSEKVERWIRKEEMSQTRCERKKKRGIQWCSRCGRHLWLSRNVCLGIRMFHVGFVETHKKMSQQKKLQANREQTASQKNQTRWYEEKNKGYGTVNSKIFEGEKTICRTVFIRTELHSEYSLN